MAKRSTRKRILDQVAGIRRDIEDVAARAVSITEMSAGRPPEAMILCESLVGVMSMVDPVAVKLGRLYKGAPGRPQKGKKGKPPLDKPSE